MLKANGYSKTSQAGACLAILFALALILCGCEDTVSRKAAEHVYSHRGASGEETEHTIAAYDLALLYGSKYVEQDVVLSADGTLWISHDRSAMRITGDDHRYSDLTDDQISQLRTEDGQRILTLDEVFSRYEGQMVFVVELKDGTSDVDAFSKLVQRYGNEDSIIVQSSDVNVLRQLASSFPTMKRLLLLSDVNSLEDALTEDCVDIVSLNKEFMLEDVCRTVHSSGKELNIWTLNSSDEISRAIDLGVDSYFTNFTAKALALETKYRT